MSVRQVLELYLNGQKVDLNDNGGIYLNYTQKEYTNPTIVRNSFSKTLTVPGTDLNNQVFNNIWNLTRVQTTALVPYFNQSKRCSFDLFMNGELIEQGYCKLDNIQRNGAEISYQLTLYGGLGDFFYSLSYDNINGTKKNLASLDYGQDLTFTINKETVKQSWDDLKDGLYPPITFAPCYNGFPDMLDTDKVLINTSGFNGTIRVNTGNSWTEQTGFPTSTGSYSTINGYALAEGKRNLTEWQTRDLRSYLQRPVIHIPFLFDAICNPGNNGGYEVELDPDFFNSGNSYYQDAYLTLPMISELNNNKTETSQTIQGSIDGSVGDSTGETNVMVSLNGKWDKYTLTIDLVASTNETAANELYTSLRVYGQGVGYVWGGFGMQLIGLDASRNQVAGSNIWWITSEVDGMHKNLSEMTNGISMDSFKYSTDVSNSIGRFEKFGQYYKWSETGLTFTMDSNVAIDSYRIKIIPGNTIGNDIDVRRLYLGKVWSANTSTQLYAGYTLGFNALFVSAEGGTSSSIVSYSDTEITQNILLSTNYTPADYLISYCKLFNLYFDKDVYRKKIHIYAQKNFYNGAIDITENIDDKIDIKPLSFDHKWYSFKYKDGDGKLFKDYKAKYGTDYGQQRVNTGFEFDSETEELLDNIVYSNAVECLEANKYYVDANMNGVELPPFMTENVTYKLFNSSMDTTEMEVGLSRSADQDPINPKSVAGIFYDSFDKVQFHNEGKPVDGANVLLFFNGMLATVPTYWLSDDVGYMFQVNDKATWLYTSSEYDASGNRIALGLGILPHFSRYLSDTSYIYASWDFGRVKELYIPEISYLDGSTTLYERYWQAYIQDVYDVDTRIVTAYIRFEEKPTKESLKHFYYFENSYWVIQDIIDYNPTSYDLTKVVFVKVNDTNNYLNGNIIPPVPEPQIVRIAFTSISWVQDVPYGGGTADKNNCSYTVTAYYNDGSNEDITSLATITGSQEVAETSDTNRHTAGTLTLVASYEEFVDTASVTIYQQGAPQIVITSITLDNLTWVTDVPAAGGTASYNNCSYTVTAHYNNGTSEDITALAEMTGQEYVQGSTSTVRHSVGTLTVWALYGNFSDYDTVTMYQAAASTYVDLTTNPTIDATATSISYSVTASHPVTVRIESAAIPQPMYNTHPAGTSTGSFSIPANQHTYVEYYSVDAYLTDYPTVIDYNNVEQMGTHTPIYVNSPLTFKILTGGTINWMHNRTLVSDVGNLTIQYRLNGGAWTNITASTAGTSFNVSAGDIVEFKGNNSRYGTVPLSYNSFSGSTAYFEAYGNTMSMIYDLNFETATTLSEQYVFNRLLAGTRITTAENLVLPATTLPYHAYTSMFQGCSYMTTAPSLPAKTLSNSCYDEMFRDCISLNYIRCLATTLGTNSTYNWVNNVAPTGTFVKDPTMTSWPINSNNGIPIGWTLIDDLGTLTGITLENVSWVTDVPYTGGIASYQNCAYSVIGHYENGGTNDLTRLADMSYSTTLNVPATTSTTRQNVGVVNVIAEYYDGPNPFTTTVVVSAYQEAVPTPNWSITNPTSYNIYGNLRTSQSDYATLEVLAGETDSHYETVPATITDVRLAISPTPSTPLNNITLTNSRSGQSITCNWDSTGNAYVGTGTINLAKDDTLRISVG